jgi:hypothetical protein
MQNEVDPRWMGPRRQRCMYDTRYRLQEFSGVFGNPEVGSSQNPIQRQPSGSVKRCVLKEIPRHVSVGQSYITPR